MNETTRRPADHAARREALDPTRSFIVQAPAGSGKTELLIQRILTLLAGVRAPEEVCAITFTRKAAAEMRTRVIEALRAAERDDPPAEEHARHTWDLARAVRARDRELGWDLVANPARLRMTTIDAFNGALTRRLPWLSGLGAQPSVTDRAEELYLEAVRDTLDAYRAGTSLGEALRRLLLHLDVRRDLVERELAGLLARRDQWLPLLARHRSDPATLRHELDHIVTTAVEEALGRTDALVRQHAPVHPERSVDVLVHPERSVDVPVHHLPWHLLTADGAPLTTSAADLPAWQSLTTLLLTQAGDWRKPKGVNKSIGFPSNSPEQKTRKSVFIDFLQSLSPNETLRSSLASLRILPLTRYDDAQWQLTGALALVLEKCVARLADVFRRTATVDHAEVAMAARRALGGPLDPTELALVLEYRLQHILVDEFQDTSLGQYALLDLLTAGWADGDGHTLFLVGDPMQSIYHFREAEVGLFLRAWHASRLGSVRLHPLTLTVNFRSEKGVVDWVNAAFGALMPAADDPAVGAVRHEPSEAFHAAGDDASVRVTPLFTADRVAEARAVADLVAESLADERNRTIAILVRARSHAADITAELRRRGIPCRGTDIAPLGRRQIVHDILALTRALLYPDDTTALYSVLRSPLCGATLTDLLGGRTPSSVTNDTPAHIARVLQTLETYRLSRGRRPLRRLVEATFTQLGGYQTTTAEDLPAIAACLSILDDLDQGGDLLRIDDLDTRVAELMAPSDPTADGRVQIMTMHKAKGLEFDVVIVPGLGRSPRSDTPTLLTWDRAIGTDVDAEPQFVFAVGADRGDDKHPLPLWIADRIARKRDNEVVRLLYVAATRAIRKLHLVGHVRLGEDKDGATIMKDPAASTLLGVLWPVVSETFERTFVEYSTSDAHEATSTVTASQPAQILRRLPFDWEPASSPAPVVIVTASTEPDHVIDDQPDTDDTNPETRALARQVGIVVHAMFERLADRHDLPTALDAAHTDMIRRRLEREGVSATDLDTAVQHVRRAVDNTLSHERGRWILFPHAQAENELSLTGTIDGQLVTVRIDRTFIDPTGTRWIIDYKTTFHTSTEVEPLLASRLILHQAQLTRYVEVLSRFDMSETIYKGVWLPHISQFIAV